MADDKTIELRHCAARCGGFRCVKCCGDRKLYAPGMLGSKDQYGKSCCISCQINAGDHAAHGNFDAAGQECGRFSKTWRAKQ